jgi:hypothetical protein
MRRIKTVTIDNVAMQISGLSCKEIEDFLRAQREALGLDPGTGKKVDGKTPDPEKMTDVWRDMLCTSLNGAIEGEAGAQKWDRMRLITEIDLVMFGALRTAILDFSGLKDEPQKKTESPLATAAAAS